MRYGWVIQREWFYSSVCDMLADGAAWAAGDTVGGTHIVPFPSTSTCRNADCNSICCAEVRRPINVCASLDVGAFPAMPGGGGTFGGIGATGDEPHAPMVVGEE